MSKSNGTQQDNHSDDDDIQVLGHQITALVGVIIVSLVDFGVPLTPAQQSNILSMIVYSWAVGSTVFAINRKMARRKKRTRPAKHKQEDKHK